MIFDRNYVFQTGGFKQITTLAKEAGTDVLHEYIASPTITITQPGYVYIYLSNESMQPPNASPIPIEVYFDDFKVTHTKTPVVQSNDHFAHGMDNSALSYQRENSTKNNFLYNAGSEVQGSIDQNIYDMPYRGMDVSIGRMMQVDPMADSYSSHTTYNYAFNDPVFFNDPNGADPNSDGWNHIQESRNYDMERNYYNTHGIYGDDDMYGMMFGRAGTLGYDYSMPTPTSSWQDHLAGIFGTGNVDTYVNRGYWLSSDQTINTGPLQFVMPLNSQLGELTVRGIRDRWMDRWVKVGGQQQTRHGDNGGGLGVSIAGGLMLAIQADWVTPEPTDVVIPKWIAEGVVYAAAATYIYFQRKSLLEANRFKGGKQWNRDKDYDLSPDVFDWWHNGGGKRRNGNPDIGYEPGEIPPEEVTEQWEGLGRPRGSKNKGWTRE